MIPEEFSRTALLLGEPGVEKLQNSRVAVFGLGGVGSYVVEGLVRCGVGRLLLVDNDKVSRSNLNRQLIATCHTLGRPKVEAARERILSINPKAQVETHQIFYLPGEANGLINGCDYVVDAIDTVTAKLALIEEAHALSIPILSCMGTGNKLDPTRLQIADLAETSVCPLCRVMRRELRRRGIRHVKVLYSTEEPVTRRMADTEAPNSKGKPTGRHTPGSVSFVPSVAGLIIAGEVVKELSGIRSGKQSVTN